MMAWAAAMSITGGSSRLRSRAPSPLSPVLREYAAFAAIPFFIRTEPGAFRVSLDVDPGRIVPAGKAFEVAVCDERGVLPAPPYTLAEYFSIILPTIKPPSCSGMITSSAPEFRIAWAYRCWPARVMTLSFGLIALAVTVM
jgi:hypothetical protein